MDEPVTDGSKAVKAAEGAEAKASARASKAGAGAAAKPAKAAPAAKAKPAASKAKPATAKAKAAPASDAAPAAGAGAASAAPASASAGAADVVITSSKACNAFKVRADAVEKGIKAAKPTATVVINTEKKLGSNPDKGSFVVAVGDTKIVELIAMPRPFQKMKALDMDDVVRQVLAKL